MRDARRQIRVGDERATKGDQIGQPRLKQALAALGGVATGDDDASAERLAQVATKVLGQFRGVVPVGLGDRDIADSRLLQHPGGSDVGRVRIVLDQAQVDAILIGRGEQRREAHAQALRADHAGHRLDHLAQKTQAVVQRATILVVALVGTGGDELVN